MMIWRTIFALCCLLLPAFAFGQNPDARTGFNVKYRQYFSPEFAEYYGVADPRDPKRFLRLDELLDGGYVHEVWFFGSGNERVGHMPEPEHGDASRAREDFLRSQRLGFRPWSDADMDLAMGLWGDPDVTQLIGGPFSIEQVRERLAREIASFRDHGIQYWPAFLLATGEHVGCCGLRPYRIEERVYELGVHIRKAHWGHGYAQEASKAVIGYAFEVLGAAALFAGHNPANETSRRLLLKLGFVYTHNEYYAPTGLYHPSYRLPAGAVTAARDPRTPIA